MRVERAYQNLLPESRGAVVALGNFDGVHKGHQAILREARVLAQKKAAPFGVVTFEPHPRHIFFPNDPPFRLTPEALKVECLAAAGVDILYVLPFTSAFRNLRADEFVDHVLIQGLAVSGVVAGFDFTFGHQRGGNMHFLAERLAPLGIEAREISPLRDAEGVLWSSTRARDHLMAGECAAAAKILGRPYLIQGQVQKGDQRGRTLGFPTANLLFGEFLRPRFGVYAITAHLPDGKALPGVANAGRRPTVDGASERLEAHLFDFTGDLYGKPLSIAFGHFLRREQTFASLDALKAQIAKDAAAAKAWHAASGGATLAP